MYMQVLKILVENTKSIKGAKVENHKFCVSVHYRNVDEKVIITWHYFVTFSLCFIKLNVGY